MAINTGKINIKQRIFSTPAGGGAEIKFLFEKLAQKSIFLKKIFLNFIKILMKNFEVLIEFFYFLAENNFLN